MLKPVIVCRAYFVVEDRKGTKSPRGWGKRGYCNTLVRKKENSVNVQF